MTGLDVLIVSLVSGSTVCAVLLSFFMASRRTAAQPAPLPETDPGLCAFQFHDGRLIDATDEAGRLLDDLAGGDGGTVDTFADLAQRMRRRFPTFPAVAPAEATFLRAEEEGDNGLVRIAPKGPYVRVTVEDRAFSAADLQLLRDLQQELLTLRRATTDAPNAVWEEHPEKGVTWANKAYRDLAARARQTGDPDQPVLSVPPPGRDGAPVRRARLDLAGDAGQEEWYEVASLDCGDVYMRYAYNIDTVVAAETTQRNFVQTLAKTFAHLPTGLAIFDRNRTLALFNPAIVDLTGLPAEFLGSRPTVMSFFDHLREVQMMPEPKDYRSWRERLAELVAAASDDRYCETWSLPAGLTYRVTGRPHPDGAIAFLFEDISAEVSLTRRFRAEMEISQAVIDTFEDAVAVFSQLGVLTMTNAAYRQLWATNPDSSFSELNVVDATRLWQKLCEPNTAWAELRDFVMATPERASWDFDVVKRSGEALFCKVDPISAGSTLVRFSSVRASGAKPVSEATRTVA